MMIPVGVIALVSAAGVAYAAYAYQGDPAKQRPNFSPERHAAMQKAFENNDYNAWKSLVNGRGRITEIVNESNFARFAEMHRLMLEGKYEEANQIREELGLRGQNRNWNKDGNCDCPGGGGKYRKSGNGPKGNFQN